MQKRMGNPESLEKIVSKRVNKRKQSDDIQSGSASELLKKAKCTCYDDDGYTILVSNSQSAQMPPQVASGPSWSLYLDSRVLS